MILSYTSEAILSYLLRMDGTTDVENGKLHERSDAFTGYGGTDNGVFVKSVNYIKIGYF